jgi:hypothetical protein
MRKILLTALALTAALTARAQTFTNVIVGSGIPVDRTLIHGVIDYNKDGFEDLLLSLTSTSGYNGRKLKLYKNNAGNGTFTDVSPQVSMPEIDSLGGTTAGDGYVAVADFNNDGFKDILTVEAGNRLRILGGMASGAFQDISSQVFMNLNGFTDLHSYNLADINKDGYLDFVFIHKASATAKEIGYLINKQGANQAGTYQQLITAIPLNYSPLFQMFDYDSDNDLDIFLLHAQNDLPWPGYAYYYHPIKTYRNNGGSFSEVATISPVNFCTIAFRPVVSDYNQDGNFDVMAGKGDYSPNSSLFLPILKNMGNGAFQNVSNSINFSTGSCYQSQPIENDYDLDGDLDYWVGNTGWQGNSCSGSKFFQNNSGSFTDVGTQLGTTVITGVFGGYTGGIQPTWFDFDNDGDQDFFGGADAGSSANCFFFRNGQSSSNRYIKLDLVGCQSGKDAYYAKVKIKANGKTFYRIKSVSLGDNIPQSQLLHFGLGNAGTIDSLVVKWPSGQTTVLTNVAVNQTLTINEDNSCNAVSSNCPDLSGSLLQGLVGYWPFCGNANDESGNGNNGTVNGATLTADRFGNAGSAYDFSAANSSIITEIDSNFSPSSSATFSVSLWMKRDNPNLPNNIVLQYKNGLDPASTTSNYDIVYSHGFCPEANGIAVQNWPFNSPGACSPTPISLNQWYHIVVKFDNSSSNFEVYKNGQTWFTGPLGSLTPSAGILSFGNTHASNFPTQGQLDEIAIWNRALSQQEITKLYNQGICQQSITVTDTLLIHTGITSYNPVAYQNTVKVWPNPGNQEITLDAGNLASMAGWKYKVANGLGQMVVNETAINQQQTNIDLSTWGGNGIYYLHLINPQGIAVEIKKIVLAP